MLRSVLLACAAAASLWAASASDLNGVALDPFHAAHGKPVALVFVRTDCPVSNRYAPAIQHIADEYAGAVSVWLVYPDRAQSPADVREHLRQFGFHIAALQDRTHDLVKRAQVTVTPEAAVFDSAGRLVYHGRIDNLYVDIGRSRAAATSHELEDALDAVVHHETPKVSSAPPVGCSLSDLE